MMLLQIAEAGAAAGILVLLVFLFIALISIVASIFWIWMLIDAAINKRIPDNTRIAWILIILFTHLIGAAIYFFAGRNASAPPIQQQTYNVNVHYQPSPYQQGYQPPPQQWSRDQSYRSDPMMPPPQSQATQYENPQSMYPQEPR